MRRSDRFLALLGLAGALGAAAALQARADRAARRPELESMAALVRRLGLTDLCLFTEARYTRHPSQADRFSPSQDQPGGPDPFPSGSLAAPPRTPAPEVPPEGER